MMFAHIFGIIFHPQTEWEKIAGLPDNDIKRLLPYPIIMALLPAVAFYFGTTQIGWKVIGDDITRLAPEIAISLTVLFYCALMGAVIFIGWMINWMAGTYDANSFIIKGVVLVAYAVTPIFLAGILAFYPIWWLDIFVATIACCYAARLLYLGVPPMMHVPEDRGFLYASAVFMMALVYMVVVLAATAILWEYVATPTFVD